MTPEPEALARHRHHFARDSVADGELLLANARFRAADWRASEKASR